MLIPDEVRILYKQGRIIPFVGAGISRSVRWEDPEGNKRQGVSWEELVDQAARILGFTDPDLLRIRGTDLQILEYYRARKGGNWAELTTWFSSVMAPTDGTLKASLLHKALANLDCCNVFYTTNFDDFLERSFQLHGRAVKVICEEADIKFDVDVPEIVKFHGDISHPHKMVLSEADYEQRVLFREFTDYKLLNDMLNRVLLFLGYSFRDPNVSYLLRIFDNQIGEKLRDYPRAHRAYIAVQYPSKFEDALFEARNIGIIPIEEVEQAKGYVQLLEELAR